MFKLYKKRNFSDLVGDTFAFFKTYGKHYFKNYFILNGGILLGLIVLIYFFMKIVFDGMFSHFSTGMNYNSNTQIEQFFSENIGIVVILGALIGLLSIFLSLITYTFPVVYLQLLESKTDFTTKELVDGIKNKIGRVFLFFIASLFVIVPIIIVTAALCFALIFIIIGIPLIFVLFPALMSWVALSFYNYISTNNGYFESLGIGFSLLKQKLWPAIGSTVVIHIITQIIVGFVSMIPYFIGIFTLFTALENHSSNSDMNHITFFAIMLTLTMILSILMNFIFQNLILVNQGIIYYSVREENENISYKNEIDLIGLDD